MSRLLLVVLLVSVSPSFAQSGVVPAPGADRTLEALVSPTLRPFGSKQEFESYRALLRDEARKRGYWWATVAIGSRSGLPLLAQAAGEPCDPAVSDCEGLEEVVTTARKSTSRSITNNQEAGVDEGDIVKSWGRFLIVLQHGRLFSIDTGSRPGQLRLVDRVNAYADPDADTWYDEILIHNNTILVTGYSYEFERSEISLFSLDKRGRMRIKGRLFIRSEDYYSSANYATRLVDGKLVIYSPVDITGYGRSGMPPLPTIQRWSPALGFSSWEPLFSIEDVYRPVQLSFEPQIHAVSVCPLDLSRALRCRTRGIVAPSQREMYVSENNAYLWIVDDVAVKQSGRRRWRECEVEELAAGPPPRGAIVWRMSLRDFRISAARTRGVPDSQFALDERDASLFALVSRTPAECFTRDAGLLELASIPAAAFDADLSRGSQVTHVALPEPPGGREWGLQMQYSPRYLVYGGSLGAWRVRWHGSKGVADQSGVIAVPIDAPERAVAVPLGHTTERLELLGDNAVAFGYGASKDFAVTSLDLRTAPRVGTRLTLPDVGESEGRSHAFNALLNTDGGGIFGLPTIRWTEYESDSREEPTEYVDFFTFGGDLTLRRSGALAASQRDEDPAYRCEVSCIDWYGNARPIFFRDRVFALIGLDLLEGSLTDEKVRRLASVNLTKPPR